MLIQVEQALVINVVLSYFLSALIPVHDGHVKITNYKVIVVAQHKLEPVIPVLGLVDLGNACGLHDLLEHLEDEKLIIYEKHSEFFHMLVL